MNWWSELGAGRLDVVIRGAGVLVVAGVLAGGGAYVIGDGGGVEGEAHAFVAAGTSTCTRSSTPITYEEAEANGWLCETLDEAYDAANASADASTVLIVAGSYAGQTITGNRTSSNRITFDCASTDEDACLIEGQLQFSNGGDPTGCPGACAISSGPDYITLKNVSTSTFAQAEGAGHYQHDDNRFGMFILGGSSNIRLENVEQGGFLFQGAQDIEYIDGESGPCMAPARPFYQPPGTVDPDNPCELNKMDFACDLSTSGHTAALCQTQRVVIDGLTVFNYAYTPECDAQGDNDPPYPGPGDPDGCHHRNWYMNGVLDVTIRNSTFRESVFEPWATISGSDAGETGNEGILWENNQFGAGVSYNLGDYGTSSHTGLGGGATCWVSDQPSYRDVIIRFNSFAAHANLAVPGNIPSADDDTNDQSCTVSDYKVYGNLFGSKPTGDNACGNAGHAIQYRHNVYYGNVGGTCSGTGETNVGGTSMSFYEDATAAPEPGDYDIDEAYAGENLVPADNATYPCPSTDAEGVTRPSGSGQFCDAGAFER